MQADAICEVLIKSYYLYIKYRLCVQVTMSRETTHGHKWTSLNVFKWASVCLLVLTKYHANII